MQRLSVVEGDFIEFVQAAELVFVDFAHYDIVQRNCQHFAFNFALSIGALDNLPPGAC